MIPRTIPTWQEKSWQEELSAMITHPSELFALLKLPHAMLADAERAAKLFPVRATYSYLSRMTLGDPNDPLLRQILPLNEELEAHPEFHDDPIAESRFNPAPGVIHKYKSRVLLIAAPQCAIHCRYCFRRAFDYDANQPSRHDWQRAFDYIRRDDSINEVILSGGDPLALPDRQLKWLLEQLATIPQLSTVRIHSRLPIVLPSRMSAALLAMISASRLQSVLVIHANHAQEIDSHVGAALTRCRAQGLTVLNQTVLLKGVNDSAAALAELNRKLFTFGVLPYYLHLLDRVTGTKHFEVTEHDAKKIHRELVASQAGYLVPKLVREIAGENAKSAVL